MSARKRTRGQRIAARVRREGRIRWSDESIRREGPREPVSCCLLVLMLAGRYKPQYSETIIQFMRFVGANTGRQWLIDDNPDRWSAQRVASVVSLRERGERAGIPQR